MAGVNGNPATRIEQEEPGLPAGLGQRLRGRWVLPFDEWVVAHARVAKKPHRGAKLEDTLTFFHQLSTLVSSGTPLLQALKIAAAQCESIKLRAVLEKITAKVSAGSTFHAAAAAFPHVFEFQWIEAIRTGEVTGKMAQVLIELNKQIRESRETKRKVKGALMYPMILICVAIIAVTVMLWMVVPVFAKMFKDMDAKLPAHHPVRRRRLGLHRQVRPSTASSPSWSSSSPSRSS